MRLLKATWEHEATHSTKPHKPQPEVTHGTFPSGATLRVARELRHLSVRVLTASAELSPAYLSRLERGARPLSPTITEHLEAVLAASEPSSMRKKR